MLQFLRKWFGVNKGGAGDESPRHRATYDFPVQFIDRSGLIRASIINYTFRCNRALDPQKLHSSLVELLSIGDWRKLGGRLRRTTSGDISIQIPKCYSSDYPAVRYSHVGHDIPLEKHPLGSRIPKETGSYPSIQEGCHAFHSFSVPQELPCNIEHYYTTDEPLLSLFVTSFTDATIVSITFPHCVCDAMGTAGLLKAWSSVLAGRIDRVPTVFEASRDAIESVGTPSDQQAQGSFILEHLQLKEFSLLLFLIQFVWDLLTRRNMEARTIFLPVGYLRKLHEEAQAQLAADRQIGPSPFLSDGDVITAWGSQMVMLSSPRNKPAIICNVFDMRRRLSNVLTSGTVCLQNLILPASIQLSAAEKASTSLGQIAWKLRQAIVQQATDTQARRLMRLVRSSISSTGIMPLFGDPNSRVIACTNWSKAQLRESVDFSPAVIENSQATNNAPRDGTCVSYWGTTIGKADNPRDTFIIYGKDDSDNYWVHAYLRSETWDMIEAEFNQYSHAKPSAGMLGRLLAPLY